jgi:hypothetical protein
MKAILCGLLLVGLGTAFVSAGDDKKDDKKPDVHAKQPGKYEAKKGDIVYFGVPNSSVLENVVAGVKVKINGKDVAKPKTALTGAIGGGEYNFIYEAKMNGTFEIEVTPTYLDKDKKGKTSKFKLIVK